MKGPKTAFENRAVDRFSQGNQNTGESQGVSLKQKENTNCEMEHERGQEGDVGLYACWWSVYEGLVRYV